MHNYLTRDDILPVDFLDICNKELEKYNVQKLNKKITSAKRNDQAIFEVKDEKGIKYHSKTLLVATGLHDNIPDVEGFPEFYGSSIFHCPYCDGWEVRDKKVGIYARDKDGSELALALKGWTDQVVLYTNGKRKIKPAQKELLDANDIPIRTERIERLEGKDGRLKKIIFQNGTDQDCEAIFFVNGYTQQCDVAEAFGCEVNKKGVVVTNRFQQTNIPGLYVAGDAAKDMHFVVVAAAEGAKAGVIINKELQKEISDSKVRKRKINF